MSFNDTAIVMMKGYDHRINFWFMTKGESVDRMKNAGLGEQKWTTMIIKNVIYYRDVE